jgi:hypothetical protein
MVLAEHGEVVRYKADARGPEPPRVVQIGGL